jgi:hypothetical protein
MGMNTAASIIPAERIERSILWVRGEKVILDSDLASLYGVETRVLVQAVKRNPLRFPDDFMFQLTSDEFDHLKSISGAMSVWGGRRYPPYAFTEQGVAMLSSVLNSKRAVQVNIDIMRAFVRLRKWLSEREDISMWIRKLETKYDKQFKLVFETIQKLIAPPGIPKKRIGFKGNKEQERK